MEDGDGDTSLTADGQKWEKDQGASENNIVVSKGECEEECPDDKDLQSSTSHSDDNLFVDSTQFPSKEDKSDKESENKTVNFDPNLIDNTSEFVDSGAELHNVVREPSPPVVADRQANESEENNRSPPQEESSEPCKDPTKQLVSREEGNVLSSMEETETLQSSLEKKGNMLSYLEESEKETSFLEEEGNAFSSMEETENIHSSIGEEEEEAEEEEEEELQTSASSEELITKQSEDELKESEESFKKYDHQSEHENKCITEENNEKKKNLSEINNSDLLNENCEVECSLQKKDDLDEKLNSSDHENEDFGESCDVESEKPFKEVSTQSFDSHDEHMSSYRKDAAMEDSASDTSDNTTIDEVVPKEVDLEASCSQLEVNKAKEMMMGESEVESCDFDVTVGCTVQNKRLDEDDEKEITNSVENCEQLVEENMSVNSVESDSDAVKLSESENLDKISEPEENELCNEQEKGVNISSFVCEETDMLCKNGTTPLEQITMETEKPELSAELRGEEMTTEIVDQDSQLEEMERSIKSTDLDNTVCEKALSSALHEHGANVTHEESENIVNETGNTERTEDVEVSVKINGEMELTKINLLNDRESSTPGKEKNCLKRKLPSSPAPGMSCDISPSESVKGTLHYKGFKKRYIAQVSEVSLRETPDVSPSVQEELRVKNKRSTKKLILETPQVLVSHQSLPDGAQANTPLTEYAQYLGLQPTVKFKCYNCGESGFPSMLKLQEHQNICLKNIRIHTYTKPPPPAIVEPAPSTNFRITRKVYLCSACGTYYENWNLFLHMREVHKRHICLFCLLMFSQAEKLAQHISGKHGIVGSSYATPEQFFSEFKGSFFLMCCACEQMFSERDNFCDHICKDMSVINSDQACQLCRLKGAHFPTCRKAFTQSNSLSSPAQSNLQSAVANSNADSSQNSQSSIQEKTGTASKYLLQNDKLTSGRKTQHKIPDRNVQRSDKNHSSGDVDDDYDISDAASYCHVNIHEPDKQKPENSEEKVSNKDVAVDINMEEENVENEEPNNEDNQNKNSVTEEIVDDKSTNNLINEVTNEDDFAPQNESQLLNDQPVPQSSENVKEEDEEEEEEEHREMEVDEKLESQPPLAPNTDEVKQVHISPESQVINQSKSPNNADSESDTSASGADSHDSDGSSSSSEASSDENEQEEKEPQNDEKSEDSDLEKSDSDKMSIVVDEVKSDDDQDKEVNVNDHTNSITESKTNEISGHKSVSPIDSDLMVVDKLTNNTEFGEELQDNIQIAGDDVPLLELTLEETLDALPIQTVVKECVKISCSTCVYCNHAKKIAVNGKQLVLHLLAEHRFEPVVCSDSGELTPIFGFVDNLKAKLPDLQDMYFNTDSYDSADKNFTRPYDRTYECFHCHFITTLHKELYVHNRKMHQKTILLCIMCKSNFYSYSELLCHLCPGIYVPDSNILFRCCLCVVDGLPSAFRLMVHLRKRHHACDVCLETTGDQQKLSNHVWKHKLHHLCYRCGIAYRNKPDITKHLFWKHGTESVLCKKCLQKKWPHVYHFCIPPTAFLCEECNASFSRAVALKVHKRLHVGDISYECDECEEKFISKKLLRRHKEKHRQVIVEKDDYKSNENIADHEMQELEQDEVKSQTPVTENDDVDKDVREDGFDSAIDQSNVMPDNCKDTDTPFEISKEPGDVESNKPDEIKDNKKSKVVDVYDLPPLNLSSESDDSDEEQIIKQPSKDAEPEDSSKINANAETIKSLDGEQPTEEEVQPVQIVDGVWDNFKTYKANLEKREILQAQTSESLKATSSTSLTDNTENHAVVDNAENHAIVDIVMADHDYCVLPEKPAEENSSHLTEDAAQIHLSQNTDASEKTETLDDKGSGFGADHNYCFNTSPRPEDKNEPPVSLPQIPSNLTVQSPTLSLPHPSLPLSPAQPPTPPPPSPPIPLPSPKKKQKSPKKKQKLSGSSSSSDSSSNSDSSSCTCGTNCSCSSSSSSSSGSSSTSSDSDSSSSEGRRRQAARRERRRERAKRKLGTGSKAGTPPPTEGFSTSGVEVGGGILGTSVDATPTPMQIDSSGAGSLQVDDTLAVAAPESEDNDFLIRESDLDTTETETDEDFYDKYPQKQANKLLAEKRNQLLMLAAVAPVNNGTIAQPSPPPPTETQEPIQKKKIKTKRHKKAQRNSSDKKEKLKLNIPVAYYNSPSFSVSNVGHSVSPLPNSHNSNASHVSRLPLDTYSPANPEASSTPSAYHSTGSGSENESKRLSKRKRRPKKFYGDSSDEEAEQAPQQPFKWRKVTPTNSSNPVTPTTVPSGFTYRAVSVNVPPPEPVHVPSFPLPEKSEEEDGDESDSGHEAKRSSSESSNSDSDNEQTDADSDVETVPTVTNAVSSVSGNTTQQKNENLYCYCQCPYDEVSEMIACDGKDCSIEWFHFECVGIMVPPKGKWFCPDCRKKTAARSEYLLHA